MIIKRFDMDGLTEIIKEIEKYIEEFRKYKNLENDMKREIKVDNLYKMKSFSKKEDILVEIKSRGINWIMVDIYKKGFHKKVRRDIDLRSCKYIFENKNLILDANMNYIAYFYRRYHIIENWKKGIDIPK